jgi:periplasmic divalent cation tolerance protein
MPGSVQYRRFLEVSTAVPSRDAAVGLARSAVEVRLAASAHVLGPVVSVFWHLGELGEGEEWQVVLKTTADRYAELEAHLISVHPWDNPEVSAVELAAGSQGYLDWVDRTTRASTEPVEAEATEPAHPTDPAGSPGKGG